MTWLDDLKLNTVIVHLRDNGPSLKGLRVAVYDDGLVLEQVMNLDVDPLVVEDGTHFIPRERVERIQMLTGGDS
jgi:hypothetical protein